MLDHISYVLSPAWGIYLWGKYSDCFTDTLLKQILRSKLKICEALSEASSCSLRSAASKKGLMHFFFCELAD